MSSPLSDRCCRSLRGLQRIADSSRTLRHVRKVPQAAVDKTSLDDFIGGAQEAWWNGQPDLLCRPLVDNEFKLGWLLDRNVGRLRATENLIDSFRRATEHVRNACSIGHQT